MSQKARPGSGVVPDVEIRESGRGLIHTLLPSRDVERHQRGTATSETMGLARPMGYATMQHRGGRMKSGDVGLALVFSGVVLFALAERPLAGGQSNASGKGAYDRVCAECHGSEGRGKGGAD